MTPRQLLDRLAMPLAIARPTSTLSLLQMLHVVDRRVSATDGHLTVTVDAGDADVLHGLHCCVDAKRFALALSTLNPSAELRLTQRDGALTLAAGGARRQLQVLAPEDFPLPTLEGITWQPVPEPRALARAIAFLQPAVANGDAARPMLNGINADGPSLGASDGHRAHHVEGGAAAAGIAAGTIVPLQALPHLLTLAEATADDEQATMRAGSVPGAVGVRSLVVQAGRTTLQFQLIAAQALPFDRVVPREHRGVTFSAPRRVLAAACRNVARFDSKVPCAALTLIGYSAVTNGATLTIELRSKLAGQEEVLDRVDVEYGGGPDWSFTVNPLYLADACDALSGDMVTVSHANTPNTPLLVTGSHAAQRCVIQGMRV